MARRGQTCAIRAAHESPIMRVLADLLPKLRREVPQSFDLPPDTLYVLAGGGYYDIQRKRSPRSLQRRLTRAHEDARHKARPSGDLPLDRQAAIRSHASSGAACVNTVLPTDPGLQLTDAQWLTHQHLKHGLVTQPVHTRGSASVILRHDRLVGCVAKLLRSAGRAVRTEVRVEEKTEKRMDIVTTEGDSGLWADVSVVNPLARTYIERAAKKGGSAAARREGEKIRMYNSIAEQQNTTFKPLVIETSGRISESFQPFLTSIARDVVIQRYQRMLSFLSDERRNWLVVASCSSAL